MNAVQSIVIDLVKALPIDTDLKEKKDSTKEIVQVVDESKDFEVQPLNSPNINEGKSNIINMNSKLGALFIIDLYLIRYNTNEN
jgi:hypothetical protein